MIRRLVIQNVALIEKSEIDFCEGLNILSGETGAGKSVILDSVNFVLGAKADKSMIRYGETFCSVYAEFDIRKNEQAKSILTELDIDAEDDSLIVCRKFTLEGKSTVRINGIPANASILRRITSCLVDVHGQSEHFFLLKESNQLKVLDGIAGEPLNRLKVSLREKLTAWKKRRKDLEAFGIDDAERNRRMDILSFQIEEILAADLKEGEEEELLAVRAKMNSAEKILNALREVEEGLQADGGGIDAVRSATRAVHSVLSLSEEYAALSERLENVLSEMEDIGETVSSLQDGLDFDEDEVERTERRIEEIKKIKRKYGNSYQAVQEFLAQAQEQFDRLENSGKEVERLQKEMSALQTEIMDLCHKMTDLRKIAAENLSVGVIRELKTLNIPSAQFIIRFRPYTDEDFSGVTGEGLDQPEFTFSANAGEPVKPLSKIISGGEMSRFMLAIKTQLSGINGISCYIFDEIDAGISGQTAKVVAEKFAKIAKDTQIIAVSHLAQIACMADKEFLIRKSEQDGKTTTAVYELDKEGQIEEVIRLLGGDAESAFVRQHAEELIASAEKYKNLLS